MNTALVAIVAVQTAGMALVAVAIWRYWRRLAAEAVAFVSPAGPDLPSPLAQAVAAGSDMVARSIVAQAKGTFMGLESGASRQAAAVDGAIAEDLARQAHPVIGGLLDNFPQLKRTLRKNPALFDMAIQQLAGKLNGAKSETSSPGGDPLGRVGK